MRAETEKRALQAAVAVACVVPLMAGLAGVISSAAMLGGVEMPLATDLDSHFRYLSGLLLGIGLGFLACIPDIERKSLAFRLLALAVVVGGLSRLVAVAGGNLPSIGHQFGLVMELGVVPLLALWQARIARRFAIPQKS